MLPKIAINGRFLTQRVLGVQRFAGEVVKAIDQLIDAGEYAGLAGRIEIVAPSAARELPLRHIPVRRCGVGSGYFWEQLELPLHVGDALLLNLCILGPLALRRQIVVVHDATVPALPVNFPFSFRAAYNVLVPALLRRARWTATVSEFSRREIGKWYGVDVSQMPVCFEGGDHITEIPADYSVIDRLGLAGRKFFLGVGITYTKNVDTLLAAFDKANLPDTLLVLAGNGRSKLEIADSRVRATGYVTDPELRALYHETVALAFPSRYEGFGLPPVEAMTCGCPVIISDQPALVEMCGDAALQCGVNDADELARLMRLVHDEPDRRSALIAAGQARAGRFTWRATAGVLLELCLQAGSARQTAGLLTHNSDFGPNAGIQGMTGSIAGPPARSQIWRRR